MSWWLSPSGINFRKTVNTAAAKHFNRIPTSNEILTFIFEKTGINPSVVEKWRSGGNPSIINIQKILNTCNITEADSLSIISGLRKYKAQKEREKPAPTETVRLKAIINEFNEERQNYWLRVYKGNKFVYGDCIGAYGYGHKLIATPVFRKNVAEKLGHNNFEIVFDAELSIPERVN